MWLFLFVHMTPDLEIKLLKETIAQMRDELEKAQFGQQHHAQQAVAAANDEIRQLRASIVELREQLETREVQHDEKVRKLELQHEHEKAELRRSIAALREKLEQVLEGRP